MGLTFVETHTPLGYVLYQGNTETICLFLLKLTTQDIIRSFLDCFLQQYNSEIIKQSVLCSHNKRGRENSTDVLALAIV